MLQMGADHVIYVDDLIEAAKRRAHATHTIVATTVMKNMRKSSLSVSVFKPNLHIDHHRDHSREERSSSDQELSPPCHGLLPCQIGFPFLDQLHFFTS
jgi:hypothetical protein